MFKLHVWRRWALLILLSVLGAAQAAPNTQYYQRETEDEKPDWQEVPVVYPAAPIDKNQLEIYLGATVLNRFWVDSASINVGTDGMVRYTLTVLSSGGVRGSSYEGIRCETRELRRYAVLKDDGTWAKSRNESWMRITESPVHRQHAVLYLQHFCPNGAIVNDAAQAIRNLKRGGSSPLDSPTQNY